MNIIKNNSIGDANKIVSGDDKSINIYGDCFVGSIPELDSNYKHREEESTIIFKLKENGIMCIYGMSGIGKTSISIAIANIIKEQYSNIMYIDGQKLKSDNIDNVFYIDKVSYKANLETFLLRQKTLLIIDNVTSGLERIVNKLKQMNLSESNVLITTQSVNYIDKKYIYELGKMKLNVCKNLLLEGIETKFDIQYIERILTQISNNPLMIKIINYLLKDGITLEELCEDNDELMNAEDIDTQQNVSDRIMKVFMNTCKNEIKVLRWLDSTYVDKSLLKHMLKLVGLKKIENRGIFDGYNSINSNTIKIHDLILNAIKNIVKLTTEENNEFSKKFIDYYKFISNNRVEENKYCNALYMHKDKIKKINENKEKWGIEVYLALKCSYDYEFDYKKWEAIDYSYLENCNYTEDKYFDYISVIEFLERKKNSPELLGNKDKRDKFIYECIEVLKRFLKNNSLDNNIKFDISHHLGKFYVAAKKNNLAKDEFEKIINTNNKYYPSKLQLIRLYQKENNLSKSKEYINEILDDYKNGCKVDTTIVLATLEELRKKQFNDELNKFVLSDLEGFSNCILESSNLYFDLPFKVFVDLGKKFSYTHSEIYKKIANNIPMKLSTDINDNRVLFSMGEFYKDFVKSDIWNEEIKEEEKTSLLEEAEKCYNKMTKQSNYEKTSIVGYYILANKPKDALKKCEEIKEKNEPFIFYYMSQAYELIYMDDKQNQNIIDSLNNIDESIKIAENDDKYNKYMSTFYRQKAKILKLNQDKKYIDYYNKAIQCTKEEKFKKQLRKELIEV